MFKLTTGNSKEVSNDKFYIGQKLKNSPVDDFPYFEIIDIKESLSGLKYYRVIGLCGTELVLHEEDLYPL